MKVVLTAKKPKTKGVTKKIDGKDVTTPTTYTEAVVIVNGEAELVYEIAAWLHDNYEAA